MDYEDIIYEVADHVATTTLNRPDARNGYTNRMADELAHALSRANDDDDVRVVVLTGAGKHFCVGADLSAGGFSISNDDPAEAREPWVEPATRVARAIYHLDKPVIVAIRGAAVGVGSTMILPADFRLAARDSRFGFVFARRGIYPEGGSTWFLPRLVGMGRAMDWMVSGRIIEAEEALASGLVTSLHDDADVLDKAYELARDLIANTAPVSVAVIRKALYRMSGLDSPEPAFDLDSLLIDSIAGSADAKEGVASFFERRQPNFPGLASTDQPAFLPWREPTE